MEPLVATLQNSISSIGIFHLTSEELTLNTADTGGRMIGQMDQVNDLVLGDDQISSYGLDNLL